MDIGSRRRACARSPGRCAARERIRAIVGLVDPALPVWDLCCDLGQIGAAVMAQHPEAKVIFVDRAARTAERLGRSLSRRPDAAGRYCVVCADLMAVELPAGPVNFIVAGVSTNVICAFLARLRGRDGDRIICNTFQDAARFEARARSTGFLIEESLDVATRNGRQRLWRLEVAPSRDS
jgi:hypothetical protein